MNTTNIHDYHGTLQTDEAARLNEAAQAQEQIIRNILQGNPKEPFAYFNIQTITGFDKDSSKRSLSNLSGSANHERYKDQYGQWPVTYDKDRRKKNPKTGKTCGTYQWNPAWGKYDASLSPQEEEQGDMFGAPKVKYQNGVSL